jgi:hypothetical protein
VYLSVTHGYQIGQQVRLTFPGGSAVWGAFGQLDGMQATIVNINQPGGGAGNRPSNGVNPNTITLNIDTSAFGAWVFAGPTYYLPAPYVPFTPAQITPIGEYTAQALANVPPLNILSDATINTGIIGMQLGGGLIGAAAQNAGPAGGFNTVTGIGDSMFWIAGNTFTYY